MYVQRALKELIYILFSLVEPVLPRRIVILRDPEISLFLISKFIINGGWGDLISYLNQGPSSFSYHIPARFHFIIKLSQNVTDWWRGTRSGENGLRVYITERKINWVSHIHSAINHEWKSKKNLWVSFSFVSLESWKINYFLSSSFVLSYTLRKYPRET